MTARPEIGRRGRRGGRRWPRWVVALPALAGTVAPLGRAEAQLRGAPVIALGPAIPAGAMRDAVREGITAKIGVWWRSPRLPVGVTTEALITRYRGGTGPSAQGAGTLGGATFNLTTRRHDRTLDLYGVAGVGWYWQDGLGPLAPARHGPGVNVGLGELVAIGRTDAFVEMRLHAIRMPARADSRWLATLPLVLGVRF